MIATIPASPGSLLALVLAIFIIVLALFRPK